MSMLTNGQDKETLITKKDMNFAMIFAYLRKD
jgi:hypothetical protein